MDRLSLATIRQKLLAIIVSVKIKTISISIFFQQGTFFQQDDLSLELLSNAFEVSIHSFIHSFKHSFIHFLLVLSLIWGHHSKMKRQLSSICFACAYSSHNPLGSTHTHFHIHIYSILRPIKLIQFTNSACLCTVWDTGAPRGNPRERVNYVHYFN